MIQGFRQSVDREKDYTSLEILDILKPKKTRNFQRFNKINQDYSFDANSIKKHHYSFDKSFEPKYVRKDNIEQQQQKGSKGSMKKISDIKNNLVCLKQSDKIETRHTFDPLLKRRGVIDKIKQQNRLFQDRKIDNYCQKMVESIIFDPHTLKNNPLQIHSARTFPTHSKSMSHKKIQNKKLTKQSFHEIKFLGKGKFGSVHLVAHKQTGFICAMKKLDKKMIRQQKMEIPIMRQIRIHSSLSSANIIQFYGFFDDPQFVYILLEFATGGAMLSLLKNRTRLQQEEIIELIKGVCEGLSNIHKKGFIHRDLKPENIVMNFGVPKICDFGWATNCDNINLVNSYCGTPLYLSPEMIKKQFYGSSVDVWTIGHLTYQLLVGRVAFSIWSQDDLKLILSKQVKIPEYIDRSQQCEDFIIKSLEKSVINRISLNQLLSHKFLSSTKQSFQQIQFQQKIKLLLSDPSH